MVAAFAVLHVLRGTASEHALAADSRQAKAAFCSSENGRMILDPGIS